MTDLLANFLAILEKQGLRKPDPPKHMPAETAQDALREARRKGQQRPPSSHLFAASDRTGALLGFPGEFRLQIRHENRPEGSRYFISPDPSTCDAKALERWKRHFARPSYTFVQALQLLIPFERIAPPLKHQNHSKGSTSIPHREVAAALMADAHAQEAEASYCSDWVERITPAERKALLHYSDTAFAWVNATLRQARTETLSPDIERMVTLIDRAIAKGCFDRPVTLYRGVSRGEWADLFPLLRQGEYLTDRAYVSTSLSLDAVSVFLEDFEHSGCIPVLCIIKLKAGSPCAFLAPISAHPDELEVLLPRNSLFRVRQKEDSRPFRRLFLEVVHK